ncbi:MAG TPA: cyclase [Lachnoclostridium phytofermentans]|uniref:Cyclase n=2 Tax=Lachnoclostridium TaxID=1506553 RepID=A0A3D2X3H6_9FIRM|nr:cyclase [Lachnoclostridium phytofermentans]
MEIYDITQELFSCRVFPGDEAPRYERVKETTKGDVCNLTVLHMCAHNGTHIDAPYHFIDGGKTVDQIDLTRVIGECTVVEHDGVLTCEDVQRIMLKGKERILLKGKTVVSFEAAQEFNHFGVLLVGNESQTIGPEDSPMQVHLELFSNEVVLLEGMNLSSVPEGDYFLFAAPLNLAGADGAPCRAVLIRS